MKLKIFLIISFLFVSVFSFSQSNISTDDQLKQYKQLLENAVNSLQETTALLEEANKEIKALKEENKKLKEKIENIEDNNDLAKENATLQTELTKANNALIETNQVLEIAKERIEKDQEEITALRKTLQEALGKIEKQTYFGIGAGYIGYIYAPGAKIIGTVKIPRIPITINADVGLLFKSGVYPLFSIGVLFNF